MSTFKMSVAFVVLATYLLACGKKDDGGGGLPALSGSATITAAPPTATAAPAAGSGTGKILAQCMNKTNASCKETYRFLPAAAEDFCKGLDGSGVFSTGDKACPKDSLIATCEFAGETQTEITYHYRDKSLPLAQQLVGSKTSCGFVDGKFVEVPLPPATKAVTKKK